MSTRVMRITADEWYPVYMLDLTYGEVEAEIDEEWLANYERVSQEFNTLQSQLGEWYDTGRKRRGP